MTQLTRAQRASDAVTTFCGSWTFIVLATVFTVVWVLFNIIAWTQHWDPYPFILLNLVFTVVELYQGPLILMSENRQTERDREHWQQMGADITEIKQLLKGK